MQVKEITIKTILETLYLNKEVTIYQIEHTENGIWKELHQGFFMYSFEHDSSRAIKPFTGKVVEVVAYESNHGANIYLVFSDGETCPLAIS